MQAAIPLAPPITVETKVVTIATSFSSRRNSTLNMATDEEAPQLESLLQRIAEHQDRAAFAELFQTVAPKLKSFVMRSGLSEQDAEEIVQEAMITVWHKAHQFDANRAKANTWLYTIVRNKRIDFYRKHKNDALTSDDLYPEPQTESLESSSHRSMDNEQTRQIIEQLPENQRQIIFKAYFEGKSHSEISEETDLPLGTIKSRLRLALKKLQHLTKDLSLWLIIILPTLS